MTWKTSMMAAAAAMALALPVHAAAIPGLFNTGTDANNLALGADGLLDPHYSILSSTSPGFAGNQAVTFSHPAYVVNDADSGWLSLAWPASPRRAVAACPSQPRGR